jgi:hypothetical protein
MKIYINHFNLFCLNSLLKDLKKYHLKTENYLQFYSSDGIFIINESEILQLKPIDRDITMLKNFYNDFTLIVDPSFYIVEKVFQIPTKYALIKMKKTIFTLNNDKNSNLKLVIEMEIIDKIENGFNFLNTNNNDLQFKDIYFELPNETNIDNILVKEELIVFLSLLN